MGEDSVIQLPFDKWMPSQADKKDAKYCPYHHRKGHTFEQWMTFKRIFDKKLQELLTSMSDLSRITTMIKEKDKWVSALEKDTKEDVFIN